MSGQSFAMAQTGFLQQIIRPTNLRVLIIIFFRFQWAVFVRKWSDWSFTEWTATDLPTATNHKQSLGGVWEFLLCTIVWWPFCGFCSLWRNLRCVCGWESGERTVGCERQRRVYFWTGNDCTMVNSSVDIRLTPWFLRLMSWVERGLLTYRLDWVTVWRSVTVRSNNDNSVNNCCSKIHNK